MGLLDKIANGYDDALKGKEAEPSPSSTPAAPPCPHCGKSPTDPVDPDKFKQFQDSLNKSLGK